MHAPSSLYIAHSARISVGGTSDHLTLISHQTSGAMLGANLGANCCSCTISARGTHIALAFINTSCMEREMHRILFYLSRTRDPNECHSEFGWEYETFRMEPRLTELPLTYWLVLGTAGRPTFSSVSCSDDFLASGTFRIPSRSFPSRQDVASNGKGYTYNSLL